MGSLGNNGKFDHRAPADIYLQLVKKRGNHFWIAPTLKSVGWVDERKPNYQLYCLMCWVSFLNPTYNYNYYYELATTDYFRKLKE